MTLGLALALTALVVLAASYQQLLARTVLLEARLSTTADPTMTTASTRLPTQPVFRPDEAVKSLPPATVTVFLTLTCMSCRRLAADLADPALHASLPVVLRYDRDAPELAKAGEGVVSAVHTDQHELVDRLGLSLFPHAVVVQGDAVAHSPVADLAALTRFLEQHGHAVEGPGLASGSAPTSGQGAAR